MLEIQNLTKKFNDVIAVNDISFSISQGEVLGFLGPNGAGKSTTMKMITGFIAPTEGTVKINAIDVLEDPDKTRAYIGYLPERTPLYEELNVTEYLNFVADARAISTSNRTSRIQEVIQSCGLEKMLKKPIGELSKGYRQRVGLAQALIHKPDILILDEPTSGLDPNQIVEIRELIKEIGKEKTVILSTHILQEVSATCSRMIIIHEGKLVAQGTPQELTQKDAKSESVIITFKASADEIIKILSAQQTFSLVEPHQASSAGYCKFRVRSSDSDLPEQLFHIAAQHHIPIVEMYKEQRSLEEVFKKLTTETSNHNQHTP